jgi:Putative DNA-binding domain
MIPKPLLEITEADVVELKSAGVQEGQTIEYKRDLPGTRDEDKREFLADVSSFANANRGDIVYGVSEAQGVITDIVGVSSPDVDSEISRLENLVRDGIAPRMNSSFRVVPGTAGKVLIARIEKSWIGPHRVIFRGHDKFYARTSAGKFPMDVSQLRTAFLQSESLSEQIRGYRVDRTIEIANHRTPIPLVRAPTVVLHVIPFTAFSSGTDFNITSFYRDPSFHRPWNASSYRQRMTFEGMMIHEVPNERGQISCYAHFYRNGLLEAVHTMLLETHQATAQRLLPHQYFEETVVNYLADCFQSLPRLGIQPPVSFSLTLVDVRGLRMAVSPLSLDRGNEIIEQSLSLPSVIVEDFSVSTAPLLKPMFDRVWNACGLIGSPNFDSEGKCVPVRALWPSS